jgi:hypothetical protein
VTCNDDGTWTLTLSGNDGTNSPVTDTTTLTVANVAPGVSITSPADLAVLPTANPVNVSAALSDAGSHDTHTCSSNWGDGTTTTGTVASGVCSGSHTYGSDGVWTITVTATDDDGAPGSDSIMVTTTSASDKVTGGGFITTDGRTSFGLVAKGSTGGYSGQIQVRAPGKHRFHGKTVTSLTVSGNTASWSGTGTCDGTSGYTFQVTVQDNRNGGGKKGTADTFAVTIKNSSGATVFSTSGALKGGNITVHS